MSNKLTFRIDDVSPYMDYSSFYKTMDVLQSYGCKPLLGIVPINKDENIKYGESRYDFWEIIKNYEKNGCLLAMHGYEHLYHTISRNLVTYKKNSEFAGMPYDLQLKMIERGAQILRENDIFTNIFFAPGHTFDKTTLKCLAEKGFKVVSDGRSNFPYIYKGIKHIPVKYYGYPRKIKGIVTIALHPCASGDKGLEQLRIFLEKHNNNICDYSEVLNEPCKPLFFQKISEKTYMFYEKFFKKIYYSIKHLARRILKGKKT